MSRFEGLLDTLREARRYVRSHPDETRKLVICAIGGIGPTGMGRDGDRLIRNLLAGSRFILVAPDVLAGYITGAILEIQDYEAKKK